MKELAEKAINESISNDENKTLVEKAVHNK
jgi:hypothetical protein